MFAALLVFAGSLSEGSGAGLVPSGSVLAAMSASPERGLLGDHDPMEVLNSRVVLRPTDPERSRAFYRETLGLAIYREFGDGPERGTVFFLGAGFLELSGRAAEPPAPGVALWLQVRDLAAARQELGERGVGILGEPRREPWGLLEMWIADPDGLRICIVEVPAEHPLRRRA
jgi:catechol 2,3-dioxygenase-like lactoylglutathione lyase family enzyme